LTLFVIVRGHDDYGNLFMHLQGNTLIDWLHVSKYPLSLVIHAAGTGLDGHRAVVTDAAGIAQQNHQSQQPGAAVRPNRAVFLPRSLRRTVLKPHGSLEQTYAIALADADHSVSHLPHLPRVEMASSAKLVALSLV